MSYYSTVINQLLQLIPRHKFDNLVKKYEDDRYVRYFNCWQLFITLLYAQIRKKDSLRDIETSLMTQINRWYHLGLKDIKRSTLSDANNRMDYRVFKEMFYAFLDKCISLSSGHKFKFKNPLYSLDSTVIELCLSVFPWAKFRRMKGALKIHCLYDHSGSLPSFLVITDGKQHDIKVARSLDLPLLPDSIISIDRAYIDYKWLYSLNKQGVYFVSRSKKNMKYEVIGQHKVDVKKGVIFDVEILLTAEASREDYPEKLRLVEYIDEQTNKKFTFLTNNFQLSADTIAQIYKSRWQIEIFFKWIKQNLKIKSFLGTSKNAVLSQIWIAMIYYLLLSFIKFQTKYSYSLLDLSRIFEEAAMNMVNIIDLLSCKDYNSFRTRIREPDQQLTLF